MERTEKAVKKRAGSVKSRAKAKTAVGANDRKPSSSTKNHGRKSAAKRNKVTIPHEAGSGQQQVIAPVVEDERIPVKPEKAEPNGKDGKGDDINDDVFTVTKYLVITETVSPDSPEPLPPGAVVYGWNGLMPGQQLQFGAANLQKDAFEMRKKGPQKKVRRPSKKGTRKGKRRTKKGSKKAGENERESVKRRTVNKKKKGKRKGKKSYKMPVGESKGDKVTQDDSKGVGGNDRGRRLKARGEPGRIASAPNNAVKPELKVVLAANQGAKPIQVNGDSTSQASSISGANSDTSPSSPPSVRHSTDSAVLVPVILIVGGVMAVLLVGIFLLYRASKKKQESLANREAAKNNMEPREDPGNTPTDVKFDLHDGERPDSQRLETVTISTPVDKNSDEGGDGLGEGYNQGSSKHRSWDKGNGRKLSVAHLKMMNTGRVPTRNASICLDRRASDAMRLFQLAEQTKKTKQPPPPLTLAHSNVSAPPPVPPSAPITSADANDKQPHTDGAALDSASSSMSSLSTDQSDDGDGYEFRYEVTVPWIPQRFDELALAPGEMVVVYKVYEDGWCDGRVLSTGEEGVFPMACLRGRAWSFFGIIDNNNPDEDPAGQANDQEPAPPADPDAITPTAGAVAAQNNFAPRPEFTRGEPGRASNIYTDDASAATRPVSGLSEQSDATTLSLRSPQEPIRESSIRSEASPPIQDTAAAGYLPRNRPPQILINTSEEEVDVAEPVPLGDAASMDGSRPSIYTDATAETPRAEFPMMDDSDTPRPSQV
ncbi:hypothetical protein HDU96_002156 [Phlyctochytrium bullatum]|nr:hypothetical protein HDU96_002156 [Phlyctochytrium bullatum]